MLFQDNTEINQSPITNHQSPTSRLFDPVDITPLVFFRIIFGILGFADVMGVWTYYHLYKDFFNPDNFQFTYYGFEWVCTFPEPFMSLFFIVLMAAAICVLLGRWYRVSTIVFAIGFTWMFLMEKALYLNHGYLFCWISWVMVFLPANRAFSGDVLKMPEIRTEKIERWSLWILPFFMGVVYFFGGIAKINPDWLTGSPLNLWLQNADDMPLFGQIWGHRFTPYIMAWIGMVLDLTAAFFLLFKKTRKWMLGFILLFHLTNTLLFQIGIFPWLSICLSLLYFPDGEMKKWFVYLKNKFIIPQRIAIWWENKSEHHDLSTAAYIPPAYPRNVVIICLSAIVVFHLLMPLRHHLFPGDVAWTEEGHRYAWRMMLRTKAGFGGMNIKNPETGKTENIKFSDYLTPRQSRKMKTHPDMVLQFAHYMEDIWREEKGVENVEIYAKFRVKLNGRPAQPFTDPEVDLTKKEWSFFKGSDWILPFDPERED